MILSWLLSGGWRYAIMGLLLMVCGVQHLELVGIRAGIAKADKIATDKARAEEARTAQLANDLDTANLEKRNAIDQAANVARDLNRTRGMYVRVRADLSRATGNTSGSQDGTIEARLSEGDGGFLSTFATDCAKDQGVAKIGHDWAPKVGR